MTDIGRKPAAREDNNVYVKHLASTGRIPYRSELPIGLIFLLGPFDHVAWRCARKPIA